ncbi:bifunctional DNA primase/polymerase [Nocardioides sp. HB32]
MQRSSSLFPLVVTGIRSRCRASLGAMFNPANPIPRWTASTMQRVATEPSLAGAAIHFANLGIPVCPCLPGGKQPLTPNRFHDATSSARTVHHWWRAHPTRTSACPRVRAPASSSSTPSPDDGGGELRDRDLSDRSVGLRVRVPERALALAVDDSALDVCHHPLAAVIDVNRSQREGLPGRMLVPSRTSMASRTLPSGLGPLMPGPVRQLAAATRIAAICSNVSA